MSKINMREFKERKAASDSIEIETDDETFTIPAPALWSDEMLDLANTADNRALSVALLGGEEVYARFVAAGGSQAVMGAILSEAEGFQLGK